LDEFRELQGSWQKLISFWKTFLIPFLMLETPLLIPADVQHIGQTLETDSARMIYIQNQWKLEPMAEIFFVVFTSVFH